MRKKIIVGLLKTPMIAIMIGAFIAAIYAAAKNISGITYPVPIILGGIIALYFWGVYLESKKSSEDLLMP